jgi:hypothetical protein
MRDRLWARRWRRARGGLIVLLLLGAAGCGGPGTVTGKISYKGQTLGGGVVVFTVPAKESVRSEIGEDGSYTISKCPTGTAKVTVETVSAKPAQLSPRADRNAGRKPPPGAIPEGVDARMYQGGGEKKGKYVWIPDKYNDPNQSGLEYTVTGGFQQHDIELPP